MSPGHSDLASLLAAEDYPAVVAVAQRSFARVLRYLNGRLYTADADEKRRVVSVLGQIVSDEKIVSHVRARDLLRRFFWSRNDESGTVPYGVPEAIGEILVVRPEFRDEFLPLLCSMLTHEELLQTGPIEQGVIWALGRVGPPVAGVSPAAVKGLQYHASFHPDEETRRLAEEALGQVRR